MVWVFCFGPGSAVAGIPSQTGLTVVGIPFCPGFAGVGISF